MKALGRQEKEKSFPLNCNGSGSWRALGRGPPTRVVEKAAGGRMSFLPTR